MLNDDLETEDQCSILCYNVLADIYATVGEQTFFIFSFLPSHPDSLLKLFFVFLWSNIQRQMYYYCPAWALAWAHRWPVIKREIVEIGADVVCLQVTTPHNFSSRFFFLSLSYPFFLVSILLTFHYRKSKRHSFRHSFSQHFSV